MARARNIKPGFFTNEALVELPMSTRLLFIGLWTLADREGRLEDRPKRIRMELFPADSVDVDQALDELAQAGMIERYEADGVRVVQVVNFAKHQNPHPREAASTLPQNQGNAKANPRQDLGDAKDLSSRAHSLNPSSLIRDIESDSAREDFDQADDDQGESTAPKAIRPEVRLSIIARQFGIDCNGSDPRLIAIAAQDVDIATFTAACEQARKGRDGDRITLALPIRILEDWTKKAKRIEANGARPPARASPAQTRVEQTIASLTGRNRNASPEIIDVTPTAAARLG